jgi:NitT/TauT family transport system permease protein
VVQVAKDRAATLSGERRLPKIRVPFHWEWTLTILVFFLMLGAWQLYIEIKGLSPLVLPGPLRVGHALLDLFETGFVWRHLRITVTEIALGFLLGSAIGIGLGIALTQSQALMRIANPYIIASQAAPKLALAPIFMLWFGFGMTPKIFIAGLIAFFPVLENTTRGLLQVDADKLELFRVLRANRIQVFSKLRLPNAMPYIFTGLRIGMILAVVGAVVGEYVGANQGLGALIIASQGNFKTSQMFAVIVILTVIGVVLYKLVELLEWAYMRWAYGAEWSRKE